MSQTIKLTFLFVIFGISMSFGQRVELYLTNASFEDVPRKGNNRYVTIRGWRDCGPLYFMGESPPDIHPVDYWEVTKSASDGNTYLGLVVRDNESWELVSQKLSGEIEAGKCYKFNIDLARSQRYVSATRLSAQEQNFTEPAVLRVWAGDIDCKRVELLAESDPVRNFEWNTFTFKFSPNRTHRYLILEAFYKTPVLIPYNGHILLDNASNITEISCEEDVEKVEETILVKKSFTPVEEPETVIPEKPEPKIVEQTPQDPKDKILQELDSDRLVEGQTIKIEKLYFEADTTSIGDDSYDVLNEIYHFLKKNEQIIVEIGGHTNGLPKHDYCDKLSSARAKEVALFLVRKGIPARRIKYKGYGKRKPIASNQTKGGRKRNQRVEIKILSLDG